jgi:hypothetical protein
MNMRAITPAIALGIFFLATCAYAQTTTNTSTTHTASKPSDSAVTQPADMCKFDTPNYILFTDVSEQDAREADLRLTRMFEEYQRRTAGFANPVKEKLPFYLFRKEAGYRAAGGPEKSAGVFIQSSRTGNRLMAWIDGEHPDDNTWSVIQHEGFHQFAAIAIRPDLPPWVDEGLAEYFGEGVWTGDGFVTGLINPHRLAEVRRGMGTTFKPFRQLMSLSLKDWNKNLSNSNYDQAWSMVHFLANADNGKYQPAFLQYMTAVSKGVSNQQAWSAAFGNDVDAFQAKYIQWWRSLPESPTTANFLRALVQTETSFLARATILKTSISDADAFVRHYQPPEFAINRDLWLPPKLFTALRDVAPDMGRWSFQGPRLVLEISDGTTFVGTFTTANNKVSRVNVEVIPPRNGRGR